MSKSSTGMNSGAGGKQFVVVDGQEAKRYDRLEKQSLIFSPDSQRLAYVAGVGEKWVVVVDGHEGEGYDLVHQLAFSPDGQRFAYVAGLGKKWVVVVDGHEGERYDLVDQLAFSPDGQRLAYVAQNDRMQFVVIDGQEQNRYARASVRSFLFSPDGRRTAYVARMGNKWVVVVEGQEQELQKGVSIEGQSLTFSPDSRRFAYVAGNEQGSVLVVDGKHCGEGYGTPVFSPDSSKVACLASQRGDEVTGVDISERIAVVDGKHDHKIVFSPDSKQLAYVAYLWFVAVWAYVVVDGHEGRYYSEVEKDSLAFSPDGGRVAYVARVFEGILEFIMVRKRSHMLVVDRQEGSRYDGILAPPEGGGVIFDSSDQLHYIARKGKAFYLIEECLA